MLCVFNLSRFFFIYFFNGMPYLSKCQTFPRRLKSHKTFVKEWIHLKYHFKRLFYKMIPLIFKLQCLSRVCGPVPIISPLILYIKQSMWTLIRFSPSFFFKQYMLVKPCVFQEHLGGFLLFVQSQCMPIKLESTFMLLKCEHMNCWINWFHYSIF